MADIKDKLYGSEQNNIHNLIQHIETNSLSDVLSYNITNRTHLIGKVKDYADSKKVFDILEKKF